MARYSVIETPAGELLHDEHYDGEWFGSAYFTRTVDGFQAHRAEVAARDYLWMNPCLPILVDDKFQIPPDRPRACRDYNYGRSFVEIRVTCLDYLRELPDAVARDAIDRWREGDHRDACEPFRTTVCHGGERYSVAVSVREIEPGVTNILARGGTDTYGNPMAAVPAPTDAYLLVEGDAPDLEDAIRDYQDATIPAARLAAADAVVLAAQALYLPDL